MVANVGFTDERQVVMRLRGKGGVEELGRSERGCGLRTVRGDGRQPALDRAIACAIYEHNPRELGSHGCRGLPR